MWSCLPQQALNCLWLLVVDTHLKVQNETSQPRACSVGGTCRGKQRSEGLSSRISRQVWILVRHPLRGIYLATGQIQDSFVC